MFNSSIDCASKHKAIQNELEPIDTGAAPDLRVERKVLVVVDTLFSTLGHQITEILTINRIKYRLEVSGKSLPTLTNIKKGKFAVVVFENIMRYVGLDQWNKNLLDKYCKDYGVGIITFYPTFGDPLQFTLKEAFLLVIKSGVKLKDATLNAKSSILRTAKAGETLWGTLPVSNWNVFIFNHSTYVPVAWAKLDTGNIHNETKFPIVLQDCGLIDGIKRVFFGGGLDFWLNKVLFIDSVRYVSTGVISTALKRFIQIDIDDIFVGETGTRLKEEDVIALIDAQDHIQQMVKNFQFNLGFSGKFYRRGNAEENLGDDLLLENADKFSWFGHMWSHMQPHLYDVLPRLVHDMALNFQFAQKHGIPTNSGYSVAPHHSGVYPVHEILYDAWKRVWNVCATSTEEYPHLRPARLRRGFTHKGIMVLPRQTCGLFTHTIFFDHYPGGRHKLDELIYGGELFQTIVNNQVSVFMTHMSNYGNDRLGIYTFESVLKFIQKWTNLQLESAPPMYIANLYFKRFREETEPLWGNPCEDLRHREIWSNHKSCTQFPQLIIIGPQKTGTTALHAFLSMHPFLISNKPSNTTFEEIQFFNNKNYKKGLDWYMSFFPNPDDSTKQILFEKSATYFDEDMVPHRARALLPNAKIIAILIPPEKRAYSWYQHCRAHGDSTAMKYSFHDVVTAPDTAPKELLELRNRCLNPGKYVLYFEKWFLHFTSHQVYIADGELLKINPVRVLNDIQRFLKLQPSFNFSEHIKYDAKKGYFCQLHKDTRTKCLGRGKGRPYAPMEPRTYKYLQHYYASYNKDLVKFLNGLRIAFSPKWLKDVVKGLKKK